MHRQDAIEFGGIIEKYGIALCGNLHPSQIKQIQKGLERYIKCGDIPKMRDSYTDLAFTMIVADLIWQEKQNERRSSNE